MTNNLFNFTICQQLYCPDAGRNEQQKKRFIDILWRDLPHCVIGQKEINKNVNEIISWFWTTQKKYHDYASFLTHSFPSQILHLLLRFRRSTICFNFTVPASEYVVDFFSTLINLSQQCISTYRNEWRQHKIKIILNSEMKWKTSQSMLQNRFNRLSLLKSLIHCFCKAGESVSWK